MIPVLNVLALIVLPVLKFQMQKLEMESVRTKHIQKSVVMMVATVSFVSWFNNSEIMLPFFSQFIFPISIWTFIIVLLYPFTKQIFIFLFDLVFFFYFFFLLRPFSIWNFVSFFYTLARTDLLCMLNWGTQWTMVSYLKK